MTASKDEDEIHPRHNLYNEAVTQFDALALNGKLIYGPYSTTIHDEDGFKVSKSYPSPQRQLHPHPAHSV